MVKPTGAVVDHKSCNLIIAHLGAGGRSPEPPAINYSHFNSHETFPVLKLLEENSTVYKLLEPWSRLTFSFA